MNDSRETRPRPHKSTPQQSTRISPIVPTMPYTTDPDWAVASVKSLELLGIPTDVAPPCFPRGDVASRRAGAPLYELFQTLYPEPDRPVTKTRYTAKAPDGYEIPIFGYELAGSEKEKNARDSEARPAVLYFHAGGLILCTASHWDRTLALDVARTGIPHFSVDYRLAPEARHPVPVEDCYAALLWLHAQTHTLRINPARIAVAGLSAGGGLAAAVAILARNRNLYPPLAKQILLEPMLDDRTTVPDPALAPFLSWDWDSNWTGWEALLGDRLGGADVEATAAPARLRDFRGLSRAYVDCGSLDIFAKEGEEYVAKLREAGVEVEWHLYEGVPHGFELRGVGSEVWKRAFENRWAAVRGL